MLALMPWVLMPADVPPRPAVESTFLHVGDVVGNQVVAERVTLIHRAPQLTRLRIHSNPASGIANAVGVHTQRAVRGIAHQNVSAVLLLGMGVGVIYIRSRAHRDKHSLAVRREFHR